MRSHSIVAAIACLAVAACAPESPDNEHVAAQDAPLASTSGQRVCAGAFFDRHPVKTVFTDSVGQGLPMPFAACETTMTILAGTGDYAKIAARMVGSGYAPIRFAGGKAAVALYFTNYARSDVGAYREFIVSYVALPEAAAAAMPEIPWVNNMSAAAPLFLPGATIFADRLHLNENGGERATRAGREMIGLDKRLSDVSAKDFLVWTFPSITDESSKPILEGRLPVHADPISQLVEANNLAWAMGLPSALSLPPVPDEVFVPTVNVDIRDKRVWHWGVTMEKPNVVMTSLGIFDIKLGTSSEVGAFLASAGFKGTAALRYQSANLVFSIPAEWPTN